MIRPATAADAAAVASVHRRAREAWDFPAGRALDAPEEVWAQRLAGEEAETLVLDRRGVVGDRAVVLWVSAGNGPARRLHEARGWRRDLEDGDELRYRVEL